MVSLFSFFNYLTIRNACMIHNQSSWLMSQRLRSCPKWVFPQINCLLL